MVEVNKILVTGGAGFIGSHVAEHFAKQGCQVIALDNLSRRRARDNVEYLHGVRNVKFVRGDTRDFRRLRTVASGVDAIIHTAGQVAVRDRA